MEYHSEENDENWINGSSSNLQSVLAPVTIEQVVNFNMTVVKTVVKVVNRTLQHPAESPSGFTIIPLYSIIFLLAVIGNSLVILTLVQNKRMRTITNLFLLNLSISDLFLGVFCMPFTLVGTVLRDFVFGELMCKLLPYLQGLCAFFAFCALAEFSAFYCFQLHPFVMFIQPFLCSLCSL